MSTALPDQVRESLEFEKKNWAEGSVLESAFYSAPLEGADSPPGTLLRLDKYVETAEYLLPPSTALSRLIYQSLSLRGSLVPVSAFILWPYSPRPGNPVAAWAHGTSGFDANSGPSNHKNLWQHFLAPYQLALQGYVVVGTDYAGLGVKKDYKGESIVHEYLTPPAQANDVIYSVQAAQQAFPELSKRWVTIGHSQGGGAVWGVAQRAATMSLPGYLGGVPISPYTNMLAERDEVANIFAAMVIPSVSLNFPDFKPSSVLTPKGEERLRLIHETDAGVSTAVQLLTSGDANIKPNWKPNEHFGEFVKMTSNGAKPIKGPLLVLHGDADAVLLESVVDETVQKTADVNHEIAIDYYALADVTHVAALSASQWMWMDWIGDRFAGKEAEKGCRRFRLDGTRGSGAHQNDQNWYLEAATKPWHAPGP